MVEEQGKDSRRVEEVMIVALNSFAALVTLTDTSVAGMKC